jgi:hypothetical protein
MKASELRIGNYVADRNGFECYVIGTFKDVAYLYFDGNVGDFIEENEKDLQPIPLTEEWLLKLGCKKQQWENGGEYELAFEDQDKWFKIFEHKLYKEKSCVVYNIYFSWEKHSLGQSLGLLIPFMIFKT